MSVKIQAKMSRKAGEMAPCLRALAALLEYQVQFLVPPIGQLPDTCNFSF